MDSPALRTVSAAVGCVVAALALWVSLAVAAPPEFGGVGLQVVPVSSGELVVLRVVEKTPAAVAGLRPGDLLTEIDDFALKGSDFREVVSRRLWGRPGSTVTLKFLRPGEKGMRQTVLRRVPMEPRAKDLPGVKMITPNPKSAEGAP